MWWIWYQRGLLLQAWLCSHCSCRRDQTICRNNGAALRIPSNPHPNTCSSRKGVSSRFVAPFIFPVPSYGSWSLFLLSILFTSYFFYIFNSVYQIIRTMTEVVIYEVPTTPSSTWKGWLWDSADVSKEERRFLLKVGYATSLSNIQRSSFELNTYIHSWTSLF